ncbi:MAG: tRNA (N6-threonylcarbamoyladenosine(37)-N6)-methyltransferase TrmO [Methanoregula sp.]|jgi:tRNA-Thr(GGU) m(6)t(6)A37 methyltransferase TsaA|uniref:tRNA (N6-threonylcarbamoyladenosine(37)-N6)-methyltransferase TrmO n=1 Tax=Methanoregula sp. TaxID=2052170 RepID=UPI003D0B78E1
MHAEPTATAFTYPPIGTIRSPFHDTAGMPIQPNGARGVRGTVEVFGKYREGLSDLDGFARIILIYAFHQCTGCGLTVTPFLDSTPRGVFATRSPRRPNAIGLSVVRLIGVKGTTLEVEDVDVLDGTPLLDIKPYVPGFDSYPGSSCGWLEKVAGNAETARSDDRFR